MKKIDGIVARIQQHFNAKTRKEMMEKWGIPVSTLKTWVHRDSIPRLRLVELAEKESLNIEWLLHGTSPKYSSVDVPEPQLLTKELAEQISMVAESIPKYGQNPLTKKLCATYDALDNDKKQEVLDKILPIIISHM